MKKNYFFAIITVFIWATMAAVVKKILFNIPNLEALSISSYLAAFFLFLMNVGNGKVRQMKKLTLRDYGIMSGLGFIGVFIYSALYFYGLTQLTSQEACIINYLWPIMLVVFSCVILREKLTVMKGVAMICSFLGIVILSTGNGGVANGNAMLGIVACAIAAACYGLFSVLNKKANYDQGIAMMIIWLVTGVCSMVLGLLTETWVQIRGSQWLGILWLGVVINAVAYLLWALALKGIEDTAKIANLAFLTPFLSLVVSTVFLKERIQIRALVALVFIIGGILLQSTYDGVRNKKD